MGEIKRVLVGAAEERSVVTEECYYFDSGSNAAGQNRLLLF